MGAGEDSASGSSPGVKPGALTVLLKEIAVAPEEARGSAWEGVLNAGAVVGRFELVRELGHGGFGVVWEARDRELGRSVAFKAVLAGGKTTVREERLLKEAEAAAQLQHPNIVTLHDVGRAEQGPYLILELLRGRTLAQRRAQGALSLREALRIGVEATRGVAHAHAHGVVHRDLTPGNVFLCDDGQVKVLDFGMAHAFGQRKVDGGTRAYMAPEQSRGAPEDERTDVFALGVILHEMLSGELPFPDAEALASTSPAPELEVPEAPALGELVGTMLEKDPVKRPRDAGEVLSALTSFQRELERLPSTGSAQVRTRRRSSGFRDLIAELKRRRVIRALVGYAIVSFAVLQVVEPVLHGLHLPDSTLSVIVVLLGIGFPITVALAWVFDLTAAGIARTPTDAESGFRGARLAVLLIGLGVLAGAPGLAWYFLRQGSAPPAAGKAEVVQAPTAPSIAVLPFADMSPQHDQEYFSDGIAEEILNALAQVDGLRVIGRTSSFSMKGKNEDLHTIGQRLSAANLLEGSVRKSGSRVRIVAQLIEAEGGSHLWSQEFDRELTDVFAVQDEIAHAVVAALKVKLLPPAREERPTANPEAHDLYLRGLALLSRGSAEAYERSVQALRKSVELDPGYAQAWAALARALFWFADQSPAGDPKVNRPKALAAAERAIALAPNLADGYFARGVFRLGVLQDWPGARTDLERARLLNPGSPGILLNYGDLLATLGRLPEAITVSQEAAALDPLSADVPAMLSTVYLGTGQAALAEAAAKRALEISPEHERAARNLGFALLLQNRLPEARAAFHRSNHELFVSVGDVLVEHTLGHAAESQRVLDGILAKPYVLNGSYQIAQIYAWRGDVDRAFEWLGHAVEQHDAGLTYLKYDPLLRSLRGDPRYKALLKKMNLPVD